MWRHRHMGQPLGYCDVTMSHCSHGYLWTHDVEAIPNNHSVLVEVDASYRDCLRSLNCVAHDFIILHIVVLSFSDSRVSTRGINCGAVNCHGPRATHTARTIALQRWVESRNYPSDKFISYTSWFNLCLLSSSFSDPRVSTRGIASIYIIAKISAISSETEVPAAAWITPTKHFGSRVFDAPIIYVTPAAWLA